MTRCHVCGATQPHGSYGWLTIERGNGRPRDLNFCTLECLARGVDDIENRRATAPIKENQ